MGSKDTVAAKPHMKAEVAPVLRSAGEHPSTGCILKVGGFTHGSRWGKRRIFGKLGKLRNVVGVRVNDVSLEDLYGFVAIPGSHFLVCSSQLSLLCACGNHETRVDKQIGDNSLTCTII